MLIAAEVMKDQNWKDKQALERYTLIAQQLDEGIDPANRSRLRKETAAKADFSGRTLYHYEAAYYEKGFAELRPAACERRLSKKLSENYLEIVEQIIFILEQENRAAPRTLKRSTLERYLYRAGFGVRQMQMYKVARQSSSKVSA